MAILRDLIDVFVATPPDDASPSVSQANSYREVVSLQAMFVTLTVALLAYVTSEPVFQVRVDLLFAVLALVPLLGLFNIVRGQVKTDAGDVYVCTKPIRSYARQSIIMDVAIVAGLSWLYWRGQLPGQ